MKFVPMDPDVIRELLSGHQDVLTPAVKARVDMLNAVPCPNCGGQGSDLEMPKVRVRPDGTIENLPFDGQHPDISGYAKCRKCRTVFEPVSRVIINLSSSR